MCLLGSKAICPKDAPFVIVISENSIVFNVWNFTKFDFSLDFLVRIFPLERSDELENPIELKSELEKSNLGVAILRGFCPLEERLKIAQP